VALCHGQRVRVHGVHAHLHGSECDPPGPLRVNGSGHVHEGVRDRAHDCARGNE